MTDHAPTLKPCPFCGYTKPIRPSSYGSWMVVCPKCDAVGPYSADWPDGDIPAAIDAWNARADGPDAAEIERLRDLLGRMCVYFCECEGTDYIGDPEEHYHGFDMGIINQDDAKEIARYRNAARAKMEGETQ